jgi:hypothetical protein
MKTPPYNITRSQFAIYKGIQTIRMAWVGLWAALLLFTVVLVAFLCAVFVIKSEWTTRTLMGATDTTLGFALRAVYSHLFPSRKEANSKG